MNVGQEVIVTHYGEGRMHKITREYIYLSDPDFLIFSLGSNCKLSLGKVDIISMIEGDIQSGQPKKISRSANGVGHRRRFQALATSRRVQADY